MGKATAEKPDTTAKDAKQAHHADKHGVVPAVVSHANTTVAERIPELAPEHAVECAKRMASLPFGRPDSAMVWRNLGQTVSLTDKDAEAFVAGLADAGKLQTLVAMAKAAVEASRRLNATVKTVEAARAVA